MRPEYVMADPTGNITALVTSPVPAEKQAETALRIMRELERDCEQVGFVSGTRMRMMGGEFCGNATMSFGCLIARREGLGIGETKQMLLDVSGADGAVRCSVTRLSDAEFSGTVAMPLPLSVEKREDGTLVRFEGIAHLITDEAPDEAKLLKFAREIGEDAAGRIQTIRNGNEWSITPLVYVKATDSAVYEHGCGSGSAAAGIVRALEAGADGTYETYVKQPGGVIAVCVKVEGGAAAEVTITGKVTLRAAN